MFVFSQKQTSGDGGDGLPDPTAKEFATYVVAQSQE